MTKNEIEILRANLLGGMNAYVRDVIKDEDILNYWFIMGIPKNATEENLMWIARDEECFTDVCRTFGYCLNQNKYSIKK